MGINSMIISTRNYRFPEAITWDVNFENIALEFSTKLACETQYSWVSCDIINFSGGQL